MIAQQHPRLLPPRCPRGGPSFPFRHMPRHGCSWYFAVSEAFDRSENASETCGSRTLRWDAGSRMNDGPEAA